MKDTPRTNAVAVGFARVLVDHSANKFTTTELVEANFARQLERSLTAATHSWKAEVDAHGFTAKQFAAIQQQLTACQAGLDRAREDAGRYQRIKNGADVTVIISHGFDDESFPECDELDAAIDALLEEDARHV